MDSLKKNRLLIAVLTVALLLGLWAWLRHKREQADAPRQTTEELADLLPTIDREAVTELEIQRAGSDTPIVLTKQEGGWQVTAPVDGEAAQDQVDRALDRLADLEVEKVVSTNEENHDRLEVTEEKAVQLKVRGDGGELIAHLLIGAVSAGRTIVRQAGETKVLAVADSIKYAFNHELRSWRNRKVTEEDPNKVTSVAFFPREGESYRFSRGEDSSWTLDAGQPPIQRFDGSKVQNTVASLSKLTATDFAAAEVTQESAGLGEGAGRVELRFAAAADEAAAAEPEAAGEAGEDTQDASKTIVLRVSETGPNEGQHYLLREGSEVIFVVSSYHGERVLVNQSSFQTEEAEEDEE